MDLMTVTVNFWVLMAVIVAVLEENVLVYRSDSPNSVGVIDHDVRG